MQCLIIDDDLDDQEIFLMCLKEVNDTIKCLTSGNGVDAISMLHSNPDYTPDYIFIDLNMPKMNGITCLGLLKNIQRLVNSVFLLYSTTSDRAAQDACRKWGAVSLIKPVRTAELKEKLTEIFSMNKSTGLNNAVNEK